MDDLKNAIKTAILTQPPKRWPTFDGKDLSRQDFLSASEAGGCLRSIAFSKEAYHRANPVVEDVEEDEHGNKIEVTEGEDAASHSVDAMTDEEFEEALANLHSTHRFGYFERGDNVEDWVVKKIRSVLDETCERLFFAGNEQRSFYCTRATVSGTPDGLYVNFMERYMNLLEFKSVGSAVSGPEKKHVMQVLVNMGLIEWLRRRYGDTLFAGMCGMTNMLDGKGELPPWKNGVLLYVNASNYLDQQEFVIPYDGGKVFADVAKRAAVLFPDHGPMLAPKECPPEGIIAGGGACWFCDHKQECAAIESELQHEEMRAIVGRALGEGTKVTPDFLDAVKAFSPVLDDFIDHKEMVKMTEEETKALRDDIIEWVRDNGEPKNVDLDGVAYTVSLSTQTRSTVDMAAFGEAVFNVLGQYPEDFKKKGEPFDVLRVTRK